MLIVIKRNTCTILPALWKNLIHVVCFLLFLFPTLSCSSSHNVFSPSLCVPLISTIELVNLNCFVLLFIPSHTLKTIFRLPPRPLYWFYQINGLPALSFVTVEVSRLLFWPTYTPAIELSPQIPSHLTTFLNLDPCTSSLLTKTK